MGEYIDYYTNAISQQRPSYVKDTYEFVNKLKDMEVPKMLSSFLLMVNMDTALGLKAAHRNPLSQTRKPFSC